MSIPDFEKELYAKILGELKDRYTTLEFTVPPSGTFQTKGHVVPSPDLIVEDPASGRTIIFAIKGGGPGSLPLATVPRMRTLKNAFSFTDPEFVLLSSVKVPDLVRKTLEKDAVRVRDVDSVDGAITEIERVISSGFKGF